MLVSKPEFFWKQMSMIREDLGANLDVSIYVKSEFNYYQMVQISLGLENNLDVSIYANSKYGLIKW